MPESCQGLVSGRSHQLAAVLLLCFSLSAFWALVFPNRIAASDCNPSDIRYVVHESGEDVLKDKADLFASSKTIEPGTRVCVIGEKKRWLTHWKKVSTDEGQIGWINAVYLKTSAVLYDAKKARERAVTPVAGVQSTDSYYIRSGDSLNSVAAAYNLTLRELLALNPDITDPNGIYVGQEIQVPKPEAPGTAAAQCPQYYAVQSGDTWSSVATSLGVDSDTLALINNLTVDQPLSAGVSLCVPGKAGSSSKSEDDKSQQTRKTDQSAANKTPAPTPAPSATPTESGSEAATYLIVRGDTLSRIAASHGCSMRQLAVANNITNPSLIKVGQRLRIPADCGDGDSAPPASGTVVQIEVSPDQHSQRLEGLTVAPRSNHSSYDRDDWRHWSDSDRDCQNARAEVLIEESLSPVAFRAGRRCTVHAGEWVGPWSGRQFALASNLDIDHHVPLYMAHISGGANWTAAQKEAYANDLDLPAALQATYNSLNRSKGAKGPEEWRPLNRRVWCAYAQDWVDVKAKYALTVTSSEKDALQVMLGTCEGSSSLAQPSLKPTPTQVARPASTPVPAPTNTPVPAPTNTPVPFPTSTPVPAPTSTPIPVPTSTPIPAPTPVPQQPAANLKYDPFGPDRNCPDFDNWNDANEFFLAAGGPQSDPHRLDGNGDGIPCEKLLDR